MFPFLLGEYLSVELLGQGVVTMVCWGGLVLAGKRQLCSSLPNSALSDVTGGLKPAMERELIPRESTNTTKQACFSSGESVVKHLPVYHWVDVCLTF